MTSIAPDKQAATGPGELLPEQVPGWAAAPVAARGLRWWQWSLAIVFAPFIPAWFGPRLDRTRWWVTPVALVLGALWLLLCGFWMAALTSGWTDGGAESGPRLDAFDVVVRMPLTMFVWMAVYVTHQTAWSFWWPVLVGVGVVLAAQVGLALLMMPWVAVGQRRGWLFGRAWKLVAWSTGTIGWGVLIAAFGVRLVRGADEPTLSAWIGPFNFFVAVVVGWWLLLTVQRLGRAYGGTAEGPGFEPRHLRCETCGYALAMLPVTARCPECGALASLSLPETRAPAPTAGERPLVERIGGALALPFVVWRGKWFGRRYALWGGGAAYWGLAWHALWIAAVGMVVAMPLVGESYGEMIGDDYGFYRYLGGVTSEQRFSERYPTAAWSVFWGGFTVIVAAGLYGVWLGFAALASVFGARQPERRVRVLSRAVAGFWVPVVLLAGAGSFLWFVDLIGEWPVGDVELPYFGRVDYAVLFPLGVFTPGVIALLAWLVMYWRMVAGTRYANA
jgi:hypothetical protein